jgi:hypothetical protein
MLVRLGGFLSANIRHMRKQLRPALLFCLLILASRVSPAQDSAGSLDLTARITPTSARPEPVRQFTFYVLTRSYADVAKEVAGEDVLPSREEFIKNMKVSPELKVWMNAHDIMDLTIPDLDKLLTPDDILKVPEFLVAYQKSNSGGVTNGIPAPKFRDSEKAANPEKYQKQKDEYMVALKKFIETHPSTVNGMELELEGVNPKLAWDRLHADHRSRLAQLAPDVAQTKYLAAKLDTDLDGRAHLNNLPPGNYWISTLGMDAAAGDRRLRWDVPVTIQAGQMTRIELTNVNGANASSPMN